MGDFSLALLGKVTLKLLDGFGISSALFALTLLFALPLGLGISFLSMSKFKPLKAVTKTIIWVVRGVPLMLQLFIFYYGVSYSPLGEFFPVLVSDIKFTMFGAECIISNAFIWSVVAFSINYACYFSEIYRGGIESISQGQYEAGQVLGMNKIQIFFKVVLMQVVKRILAPMSNEVITLIKDTALANTLALPEIIYNSKKFLNTDVIIWPLFYSAIFYLVFVGALTLLFGYFEKKLSYYKI